MYPFFKDIVVKSADIPRPDGAVALPLNGKDFFDGEELLDFSTLQVVDLCSNGSEYPDNPTERLCATQFIPAKDFDIITNPVGTLYFQLSKQVWEDTSFPRHFRVYYQAYTNAGGTPLPAPDYKQIAPQWSMIEKGAGNLEIYDKEDCILTLDTIERRKAGFHRLTTPAGKSLTTFIPRDHEWHRGLWFGWTHLSVDNLKVRDYSFWCEPGLGHIQQPRITKEPGQLIQQFNYTGLLAIDTGHPVAEYSMDATLQKPDRDWYYLDIQLTLTTRENAVHLGQAEYSQLTARAAQDILDIEIIDSANGAFAMGDDITEGEINWCGYTGTKDGGSVALLMMSHPSNPGGPCERAYFNEVRDFMSDDGDNFTVMSLNPVASEAYTIPAGESATWSYRVVLADRQLTQKFGDYHYTHFTAPLQCSYT